MSKNIVITMSATELIRNYDADEIGENGNKRYSVEYINDNETGLDYDYFDTEKEAESYINNSIVIPSEDNFEFEINGNCFLSVAKENVKEQLRLSKETLTEYDLEYEGLDCSQIMKFSDSYSEAYIWASDSWFDNLTEFGESVKESDFDVEPKLSDTMISEKVKEIASRSEKNHSPKMRM